MRIIIDAMSGDNAPFQIVMGALNAAEKNDEITFVLVGDEKRINDIIANKGKPLKNIEIVSAEDVVTMEDSPADVFKNKKESSMCKGIDLLRGDGDILVSAGNTGALIYCGTLMLRRLPGVDRPCLATVLPFTNPVMILDCGANLEVLPSYFEQWALLGSIYYKKLFSQDSPRVGMVNNGTEECKGTFLQVDAYKMLSDMPNINFVGNIEARDVPFGKCDVLLCDGFTGNIILKNSEGMAKMFMGLLKDIFYKNTKNKLSALAIKSDLMDMKSKFNYKNYGGAPVIGLRKPIIKAHGDSDANSFECTINQAIKFVKGGADKELQGASEYLKQLKSERKKENANRETTL